MGALVRSGRSASAGVRFQVPLAMKSFILKIILPTILTILLFTLTIFLIIIPRFQQNVMNGKREMIMELTNTAISILAEYEAEERKGLISREEAQKTAITRIQDLRYGEENKDYFWITDMTPVMIIHPYRMDLNGQDLSSFTDPHGKHMFVDFVEIARAQGEGYADYMWQWKDDSLHIVPKLSYVKLFKPWNWVIGTGVYIEDVKREISALTGSMLRISTGISILIASLLLYIFKQSYNIERKRIAAEEELQRSEVKYRTLVEAATEGLIMLADGKISFANSVIGRMTGYGADELSGRSLTEFISASNNSDIIGIFSGDRVKEGQFELNLNRKNGGFCEVLLTSSRAVFYGKTVNILIVKDISADKNASLANVDYQRLISTLNLGFFRASINQKGKFLYANETAIRILGCEHFDQLSEVHIIRLLTDAGERKKLRRELLGQGFVKNKVLRISNPAGGQTIVAISLVLLDPELRGNLVCDGIIEDITQPEREKAATGDLIARLKVRDLVLEQPVSGYVQPAVRLSQDATLGEAVDRMAKSRSDCLLLTASNGDAMGIITGSDVQKRILGLGLNLDNPAYLIMSSPVVYAAENTSALEALRICESQHINHLVVRNAGLEISGIARAVDLYRGIVRSFGHVEDDIGRAGSAEELKECYHRHRLLLDPLIRGEVPVRYITALTTAFSDTVIRRLIGLAVEETGPPPVAFSFICLGSEGRKEETLLTDQDNAIIYEDVPEENREAVSAYFRQLGEKVCDGLNHVGYAYCVGRVMAKNPQWCQPLSTWTRYFTEWINLPEPKNLLDATIFFDFRNVYGEESFAESLRTAISAAVRQNAVFFYHLAYNACHIRPPHIPGGGLLPEKSEDAIDLKPALIPLVMFARIYALQQGISYTNTAERLEALRGRQGLGEETAAELLFAYNFLMKLRFRSQAELAAKGLPLSNVLHYRRLIEPEGQILRRVLASIPEYQNKLKSDFRISV
jgi:PAS domain S-box-containing protein